MKTLYLLRGVSGCGKSTLAETLCELPNTVAVAADDYHYNNEGIYDFKVENLANAHSWCKGMVDSFMRRGRNVVIHNTNTSEKEIKPYLDLAEKHDYKVVSLVVENRHGNSDIHNVPEEVKLKQESRLRHSLKLK